MNQARIGDIERRLCNIVRPGTVSDVDYSNARIKVKVGDNTTGWLPWVTGRAGGNVTWQAPEKNEQVLVLSPAGEMAVGFVIPSVYQNNYPANGNSADIERTTYSDGAVIEYHRDTSTYNITLPSSGTANIAVGPNSSVAVNQNGLTLTLGSVTVKLTSSGIALNGDVTVTGKVTATGDVSSSGGDVKAASISLKTHIHGGVYPGTSVTSLPQ